MSICAGVNSDKNFTNNAYPISHIYPEREGNEAYTVGKIHSPLWNN